MAKFDLNEWLAQIMSEVNVEAVEYDPDNHALHIPSPDQSPMVNLSSLSPDEVHEWMVRRHHGVWH